MPNVYLSCLITGMCDDTALFSALLLIIMSFCPLFLPDSTILYLIPFAFDVVSCSHHLLINLAPDRSCNCTCGHDDAAPLELLSLGEFNGIQ